MPSRVLLITGLLFITTLAGAQETRSDSIARIDRDSMALSIDTTLDYDQLLDELSLFLDSITAPRNYTLIDVSGGQGYFNYISRATRRIKTVQKYTWSPTLGLYSKSGWGLTMSGFIIQDSSRLKLYQLAFTPSYDYLRDRRLATGISFTRYYTKDALSFYTSPLQNEVNAYFLWRKSWLKPGINASYGWGSRSAYSQRRIFLDSLRKRLLVFTQREESVSDFSVALSIRHDFYWLDIFSQKDFIRLSPLLMYTMGTQKFGFNRSSGLATTNVVYNASLVSLDNVMKFQPVSLTMYLRLDYTFGKIFIQPQVLFDYYFPGEKKNFSTLFSISAGIMF